MSYFQFLFYCALIFWGSIKVQSTVVNYERFLNCISTSSDHQFLFTRYINVSTV